MMTASMMSDRDTYTILKDEEQIDESEKCICGYKLRKESDYINNQGQLVSVMICDSCGAVEHWIENVSMLESR